MIDPVTGMLIIQGVSAGAQYLSGRAEAKKAERREEEIRSAGIPKMETPQEYFDLYMKAKENKGAQLATMQAQQGMADTAAALQAGGSRALIGGLSAAQRRTDATIAGIGAQAQQQELSALEGLAGAQQRTNMINTQFGAQSYFTDLGAAQAGYQAGRQMQASAINNLAQAGTMAVGAYSDSDYMDIYYPNRGNKSGGGSSNQDSSGKLSGYGSIERGGMLTPGEFSHEDNPIDLVRNGKKIGEATGGEYVFNPTQSKKMKELAEQEKSPLSRYVTTLLNRFEKDAAK
mgnify:FL=1